MAQISTVIPHIRTDYRAPKPKVRFKHRVTGDYLHLSGSGVTHGTAYAWNGTRAQARALRDRALATGEEWPFKAVKRIEATDRQAIEEI